MPSEAKLRELRARLLEICDLGWTGAALSWDQATYMPAGGAPARARQIALLGRLEHERLTDPALGRLLDALAPYAEEHEDEDARLIAVARLRRLPQLCDRQHPGRAILRSRAARASGHPK